MTDYQKIIDKYYPADTEVRGILLTHSRMVAREALEIAERNNLTLSAEEIETAAMLHDIGIIFTNASGIGCYGTEPYLKHGVIGADLLRNESVEEKYALVAERHTGSGLTASEISERGLPLPSDRSYMPESELERLICYADCFWSKTRLSERKTLERVRASISRHGQDALMRFDELHARYSS